MVRVYGNIEKFDMLFHRSGPYAGQPRGFAFVTYKLRQDAVKAMNSLNGQLLGNKRICVKFAKSTVSSSLMCLQCKYGVVLYSQCAGVFEWAHLLEHFYHFLALLPLFGIGARCHPLPFLLVTCFFHHMSSFIKRIHVSFKKKIVQKYLLWFRF